MWLIIIYLLPGLNQLSKSYNLCVLIYHQESRHLVTALQKAYYPRDVLVAGNIRVPRPATGITAFFTLFIKILNFIFLSYH